ERRILTERHPVGDQGGEYAPPAGHVGQPLDQQDRQPERGCCQGQDGDHADDLVGPAVPVQGGDHAQHGGDDGTDDQADDGDRQRDRQTPHHHVGHLLVACGGTQVAVGDEAPHEVDVPHQERVVEAVGFSVLLQYREANGLTDPLLVRYVNFVWRSEEHTSELQSRFNLV